MGVMQAQPPKPNSGLPRIRFSLRCFLRGHKPDPFRLNARGEKWHTFIYTCLRCNRVVGDSHAVKDYDPRV